MFCAKCGSQIKDEAVFCPNCGAKVKRPEEPNTNTAEIIDVAQNMPVIEQQVMPEESIPMPDVADEPLQEPEPVPEKKKTKRKVFGIIALVIVALGLMAVVAYLFFFPGKKNLEENTVEGSLERAQAMMDDGEYQDAIGLYEKALEEDPDLPDAYLGMANAYLELDMQAEAVEILEKGYEVTKSKKIRKMLDKLSAGEDPESTEAAEVTEEELAEVYTGEKKDINIEVRQVDNSNFPEIILYASIIDEYGNTVEKLGREDFHIKEIDKSGQVIDASIDDVYQVLNEDRINVNLVLDASDSMDSSDKMQQAKNAANAFIDQIALENGDQVEVISFDDYVYMEQEFSSQREALKNAVNGIVTNGSTALYDALYAGILQTYYEDGAKCVIGFTDGMENASSYTFGDVVSMAQNTGIPVFIIGIGEEYDAYALESLATQCSGKYYSANVNELETILEDIYVSIYREQQNYYVFKYTSPNESDLTEFREVVLETSETTGFSGYYKKSYVPQADISGAFSNRYTDMDYILDFSGQREVTAYDLEGLSLAELRIARNEIFARHGRQFKDSMLNQWFYSKTWYLNIPTKYAPDSFDAIRPSPLSKLELNNANFIKSYEQAIMDSQDIFPNAGSVLLSEYDLALSKAVLKNALNQMRSYPYNPILEENIRLVQEAIDKEDVRY